MDFHCFYFPLFCIHWLMGHLLPRHPTLQRTASICTVRSTLVSRDSDRGNDSYTNKPIKRSKRQESKDKEIKEPGK